MLWGVAGLIGLATVAPRIDQAVSAPDAAANAGFVVPRAPDGQYYAEGRIGSLTVRFLIDGDGDRVVLAAEDARRIGLDPSPGITLVPALAIGPAIARNVSVRVTADLPVSLIGRGFLTRHAGATFGR